MDQIYWPSKQTQIQTQVIFLLVRTQLPDVTV